MTEKAKSRKLYKDTVKAVLLFALCAALVVFTVLWYLFVRKRMVFFEVLPALALAAIPLVILVYKTGDNLNYATSEQLLQKTEKIIVTFVALFTIAIAVVPMKICPVYNGEELNFRNQYEKMTESILNGHLYLEYDVDPRLMEMDNPYDPIARDEEGVDYHWDHAFYNGHYYMYFGVVPVFLTFLPYKLITGLTLTTYHATQLYTALFIAGLFVFFQKVKKNMFPSLSLHLQLEMSVAFSLMSVWFISARPALYCTAIAAGICMEIWSFVFFFQAVFVEKSENKQISTAFWGSLFGALAFGCRPTAALANLVVPFFLIVYLKKRSKIDAKLIAKLLLAALPYFIIAALLMAYNNARFDSPFEFGQAYQLTVTDQRDYSKPLYERNLDPFTMIYQVALCLFGLGRSTWTSFPGLVYEFPAVMLISLILCKRVNRELSSKKVLGITLSAVFTVAVILFNQLIYAPSLYEYERYKSDYVWLICISCFFAVASYAETCKNTGKMKTTDIVFSFVLAESALASFALFCWPYDRNFTLYYHEELSVFFENLFSKLI